MPMHRRPRGGRPGGNGPAYAALDLGTNNCRLLIAEPAADGFVVLDAFSRIVRLGEGLGATHRLSEAAIDRTLSALRVCAGKIRRRGAISVRAVATEACRQADNCAEFLARVEADLGLNIEIITAAEEARLAVSSCSPLLSGALPWGLVFDIGGGSTEVMWTRVGEGGVTEIIDHVSVPLGVVALAEKYGGRDVSRGAFRDMVDEFLGPMREFDRRHGISPRIKAGEVQMVGTSGTVTTLASINMRLPRYNRAAIDGSFLRFKAARRVARELLDLSYEERAQHLCIGRERADLVIPGCAVLEAICRVWPVGRLRVADRGLREGILLDLIGADRPQGARPNGRAAGTSLTPAALPV
ncbi:Ppx/GppA phosphatase family protein [Radicibacter daui]|uniref:Ppx/GppA phosphatase family protein n=1 Tax=Radicibacter daui TaxID=3064829 RepID=UPI004046B0F8